MTPFGAVVTLVFTVHLFTMSLAYTTTNILCAATDVGMHGLLAVDRVSVLPSSLCTLWTSSRFLDY